MKKDSFPLRKTSALTLMELLVVLAIIGIIMMMALPRFDGLFSSVRSEEAKSQLMHLWTLQKTYHLRHARYSEDLDQIRFERELLSTEGGDANYRIEIVSAGDHHFLARATAVRDFNNDGRFSVWEIDHHKDLTEKVPD